MFGINLTQQPELIVGVLCLLSWVIGGIVVAVLCRVIRQLSQRVVDQEVIRSAVSLTAGSDNPGAKASVARGLLANWPQGQDPPVGAPESSEETEGPPENTGLTVGTRLG